MRIRNWGSQIVSIPERQAVFDLHDKTDCVPGFSTRVRPVPDGERKNGDNRMIAKCSTCHRKGIVKGLNSSGWVFICKAIKNDKGEETGIELHPVCPFCLRKLPKPPPKKRAAIFKEIEDD